MHKTKLWRSSVALLIACLALGFAVPAGAHEAGHATLFPPTAHPFGQSYPQWYGDYQIWFNEIPAAQHPINDPGGPADCALQDDKIVFVGGVVPGVTRCHVPAEATVAISPFFWECSTAEGHGETYAELRRCARENWRNDFSPEALNFTVRIDGRRLRHARRWTFITPGEVIDFPEDNIWDAVPGPSKSVTKGLFFILRPLSEGIHVVRINAHHDVLGDATFVFRFRAS